MELPIKLQNLIEEEISKINIKDLQKNAESISYKYRNESGKGKRLLTKELEALSYIAVRMPATYSSVYTCLARTLQIYNCDIKSLLDIGAGTGAGSWAVNSLINIDEISCLEREEVMINLGKKLMEKSKEEVLKNANWKQCDLINSNIEENADLVICSYVLNEINEEDRKKVLEKLWNATNKVLLIVEPGTPEGFREIIKLKKELVNLGGNIIAPCPNNLNCNLDKNDWCNATCRVSRTKVHKILKNGNVPFEDEKFSYIAFSKEKFKKINYSRVLRHPIIEAGKITLKLCNDTGIYEKTITKRDKELFKIARKVKCGDLIEL